jgi:hypothetical protein
VVIFQLVSPEPETTGRIGKSGAVNGLQPGTTDPLTGSVLLLGELTSDSSLETDGCYSVSIGPTSEELVLLDVVSALGRVVDADYDDGDVRPSKSAHGIETPVSLARVRNFRGS